jgi:hypothetical protein
MPNHEATMPGRSRGSRSIAFIRNTQTKIVRASGARKRRSR